MRYISWGGKCLPFPRSDTSKGHHNERTSTKSIPLPQVNTWFRRATPLTYNYRQLRKYYLSNTVLCVLQNKANAPYIVEGCTI